MSTWYAPFPNIQFGQLFDGRLEKYGVKKKDGGPPTDPKNRYLVGCDGFLEVHLEDNGTCTFTRRGCIPWAIFDAIAEEFDVELVSEHDHRFWGFATEKEWDDWQKQLYDESENEFYNNLLKYVVDEPNGILPGTVEEIKAKIAKALVRSDPSLMAPEKRDALLKSVTEIYDRDHAIKVRLTEQDQAPIEMMFVRTNDLPKA